MKVMIEVCGHTPKQVPAIEKMLWDICQDMPNRISIGCVKMTLEKDMKSAKEPKPKVAKKGDTDAEQKPSKKK